MKKTIYLLYLSFASVSAQINIAVDYRVEFAFEVNDTKNANVLSLLDMAKNAEKDLKFKLTFSNGLSKFFRQDIGIKNDDMEIAIIFADAENIFYSDLKNKANYFEVTQNDLFKKNEFIVKDENSIKWTLVDSTRTIANFKCYYAYTVLKKDKIGTTKDIRVDAWYTPEVPVSIGPKGYGDLPGLILQLKTNKAVYIAEKIELLEKSEVITLPTNGEIISFDKYLEILKQRTLKIDSLKRE